MMMSIAPGQFPRRTILTDLAGWTRPRAGEDKTGRNLRALSSKTAASERHDMVKIQIRSGEDRGQLELRIFSLLGFSAMAWGN